MLLFSIDVLPVILSEWSAWTPCSPCFPLAPMQFNTSLAGSVGDSKVVSTQRRYRACLDLDSGLPLSGEEGSRCSGSLVEERLCSDPNICRGKDDYFFISSYNELIRTRCYMHLHCTLA